MKNTVKKIVITAMFATLVCVATMILSDYLFEDFLYGFGASLINIPANEVQGAAGLIIGLTLITVFDKQNIINTSK